LEISAAIWPWEGFFDACLEDNVKPEERGVCGGTDIDEPSSCQNVNNKNILHSVGKERGSGRAYVETPTASPQQPHS
jgi:hypothetical protein